MNLNRSKNIFTLGNFYSQQRNKAPQNRRQNYDPFERDPFKIQSYNFRYAERPQYTNLTQIVPQRVTSHTTVKRFDSYYYNYDFAAVRRDAENSPANGFHEYRRRKYLQDQPNTTANLFSTQKFTPNGGRETAVRNSHINSAGASSSSSAIAGVSAALQENDYAPMRHQLQQHRQPPVSTTTGEQCAVGRVYSTTEANGRLNLSCPYARTSTSPMYHRVTRLNDNGRVSEYVSPLQTIPSVGPTTAANAYTNYNQQQYQHQQLRQRLATNQLQQQQVDYDYKYNVDTSTTTTTTEPERCREANSMRQNISSNHALLGRNDTRSASGRRRFSSLYDAVNEETINTNTGNKTTTTTTNGTTNTNTGHTNTIGGLKITVTDKNNNDYKSEQAMASAGGNTHHRRSLQTLHITASKGLVGGGSGKGRDKDRGGGRGGNSVNSKRNNCSGCQININIKSLDDDEINENVTIKIEAADNMVNSAGNNTYNSNGVISSLDQNNFMERVSSPSKEKNFNIIGCKSNDTIVIDKHISKYSIAPRQLEPIENKQRSNNGKSQRRSRSSTRAAYSYSAPYDGADDSDSEPSMAAIPLRRVSPTRLEPMNSLPLPALMMRPSILPLPLPVRHALPPRKAPLKQVPSERMPSMVPWCLDHNPSFNDTKENTHMEPRRTVNTTLRRQRALGPLSTVDLRQLKTPAHKLNYSPPKSKIPERKLLNTLNKPGELATPRKAPSHSSLHATHHDFKMYRQPMRSNTPTRLQSQPTSNNNNNNNNPLKPMRSLTPCTSRELRLRRAAASPNACQNQQSSTALPLNVNINVFAEKLKLLRV